MAVVKPRVLVASTRNLWPHVARASALEFEEVIASIDDVEVVAPAPLSEPQALAWLNEQAKRRVGLSYAPKRVRVEPGRVQGEYELFFLNVPNLDFLRVLDGFRGFRERCRRTVCWLDEVWAHEVDNPAMVERLQDFDEIVLATGGTVRALQPLVRGHVRFSPMAVDALRFCPLGRRRERAIDLYWMGGRRSSTMHEALVRHAATRPFFYHYETTGVGAPLVPLLEHRDWLASLAHRSKAFITYRAKIDKPEQTRGQVEIGTRYFEAGAAGCVMVGEAPATDRFKRCFDWSQAGITVPFGDPGIVDAMADLLRDPDRVAGIRRYNVGRCLEAHDWMHRFQESALGPAGMDLHGKAAARVDRLAQLREQVGLGQLGLGELSVASSRR